MRFQTLTTAILATYLSSVLAVEFTNDAYKDITPGSPFELKWHGDGTPVTITLLNGQTSNLQKVSTVASTSSFPPSSFHGMDYNAHLADAIGGSYKWTPESDLESGTYALSITQSGSTNYSPQFTIKGSSSPTTSSSNPSSSALSQSSTSFSFASTPTNWFPSTSGKPAAKLSPTSTPATNAPKASSSSSPSSAPVLPVVQAMMLPPYPAGSGNGNGSVAEGSVVTGTGTGMGSMATATATGAEGADTGMVKSSAGPSPVGFEGGAVRKVGARGFLGLGMVVGLFMAVVV